MDFAIQADLRVKLKESEKRDNYQDRARESKKQQQWNVKVTVVRIVIGTFGTVTKALVKGLEVLEKRGRVETIQSTVC